MAKFNKKAARHSSAPIYEYPTTTEAFTKELLEEPTATSNYEGGLAFSLSDKAELFTRVATSLVGEPKFYCSGEEADDSMIKAIQRVLVADPEFVLKLAAYCRNELYLRTVPLVMLTEFANGMVPRSDADSTLVHPSELVPNSRRYVSKIVRRADEIPELLAIQLDRNTRYPRKHSKIPMLIKNGLRDAFNSFTEYQFQKYQMHGKSVSMRDALFMVHPRGKTPEQQAVYDRIANGTIGSPQTWEAKLMAEGASKESWEAAIPSMGYMAILRNLRNFLKHGVDLNLIAPILTDPQRVARSKQFPFRFYSAYRAVMEIPYMEIVRPQDRTRLLRMLETAIDQSVINVPRLPGMTVVAVDVSGSMGKTVSDHSTVTMKDVSAVLGAIAANISDECLVYPFASDCDIVPLYSGNVLENAKMILNRSLGYGTEAYKVFQHLIKHEISVDRIILFSDMQCYGGAYGSSDISGMFMRYQRDINPNVYMYSVDLAGYGTAVLPERTRNVVLLSGWNERMLNFIRLFETDAVTMVDEIERYDQRLFGTPAS